MLYLAYGSNLNMAQMARRCPAAIPMQAVTMPGWRLVFREVADVEPAKGAETPMGLWFITRQCEAALDLYEGVRHGLYRRVMVPLPEGLGPELSGKRALLYRMNSHSYGAPRQGYFDTIVEGYQDFELDLEPLRKAISFTYRKMERRHERPRTAPRTRTC